MSGGKSKQRTDAERRRVLALLLAGGASTSTCLAQTKDDSCIADAAVRNSLLWAVAWKQCAAEYFALCHQAYNLARLRVDQARQNRNAGDKPLAVITDMDDTIMHAASYWGYLINHDRDFFDDAVWDKWIPDNAVTAAPGAKDFLDYCAESGVEVFYVTSRDQGDRTDEYAMSQLEYLEFPFADQDHLYVFRNTSDKTPARQGVAASFDIAVMLGDNLNDYRRDYYVKDVDERMRLMERDREQWGREFVVLPNPTDGHWVRAIFGDSEPAPTDENRRLLKKAATRLAWSG